MRLAAADPNLLVALSRYDTSARDAARREAESGRSDFGKLAQQAGSAKAVSGAAGAEKSATNRTDDPTQKRAEREASAFAREAPAGTARAKYTPKGQSLNVLI